MPESARADAAQLCPEKSDRVEVSTASLSQEMRLLIRIGFPQCRVEAAYGKAIRNQTTVEDEFLASGDIRIDDYYKRLAKYLGLPFRSSLDVDSVSDRPLIDLILINSGGLRLEEKSGQSRFAIVPKASGLRSFMARLQAHPRLRWKVVVTTPHAMREVVWKVGAKRRLHHTINRLFSWKPHFSARIVFWGKQGFLLGGSLAGLITSLLIFPVTTLLVIHITMTSLYLLMMLLRIASVRLVKPCATVPLLKPDNALPTYTIMVALYREANMVRQLTENLLRLNWPRSKLDIKLVCEADDDETIAAITALDLPPCFEVVAVPAANPRTKPKALTYALSGARGTLLTLYDAEDRPHPDQLLEAWHGFRTGPENLACLQAPLVITNLSHSWMTALFACEHAGLFRGILPFLARHRFPMPLGGTSNHFKTELLWKCRAWDPFNVAEDADLGLRLHRLGYISGVITRGTGETAPLTISSWTAQRSRWIKGWLQTLLVALRDPAKLLNELGALNFLVFVINGVGMILSSLLHPLLFVALAMTAFAALHPEAKPSSLDQLLTGIDIINILLSYWAFLRLGLKNMSPREKKQMHADIFYIPFYWLMLSYSAWKAFFELYRMPFLWRKTMHHTSS